MTSSPSLGGNSRIPFANYDIIVYFGGGIFSLPFLGRYFLASETKFPTIFGYFSDPSIVITVTILTLLFSVYIIGHGIAYLSSILIERFLFRNVDYPSSIMVRMATHPAKKRNSLFRLTIYQSFVRAHFQNWYPSDWFRLIFHLPVIPLYLFMLIFGLFGFYQSKMPSLIVERMREKLRSEFDILVRAGNPNGWFKFVEYYSINNNPYSLSRMYNYLILYGLMRSMSLVFLASIWAEIVLWWSFGGVGFIDSQGKGSIVIRLFALYGGYFVGFSAFGKFNRRYCEEAVLSFAIPDHLNGDLTRPIPYPKSPNRAVDVDS